MQCFNTITVSESAVSLPRPLATPRFYLAAVAAHSPWLRDKIWEWPGDEAKVQ